MTVRRRLQALERQIASNDDMTVVTIFGGLPEPFLKTATGGARKWQQVVGESGDAFRGRIVECARASGERFVVIGGLPEEETT